MALICGDIALASVGVSCPTAMQIEENRDLIAGMLGVPGNIHVTPFDWLICSATSAARMIGEGVYFPEDISEIAFCGRVPYWPSMGCYYWHELKLWHSQEFSTLIGKFKHTTETYHSLKNMRRLIFLLSNTQNNLNDVASRAQQFDYFLDDNVVNALRLSLEKRFGNCELYVVSYESRNRFKEHRNLSILYNIKPDESRVRGDAAEWRSVYGSILGKQ